MVRFNVTYLPLPVGPLPRKVQVAMLKEAEKARGAGRGIMGMLAVILVSLTPAALTFLPFFVSFVTNRRWLGTGWMFAVTFAMVPVAWGVMWLITPFALGRHQRTAAARAAVDAGYCAGCGYGIADIPVDGQGLSVCPECGAGWKRGAITS